MVQSSVQQGYMPQRAKRDFFNCNIFLLLIGAAVLLTSIAAKTNVLDQLTVLDHYESLNLYISLALSAALVVTGVVGAFASSRFASTYLAVSGLLLAEFLLVSIGYVTWVYLSADYSKNGSLFQQLRTELRDYGNHKLSVDTLQSTLSCCGVTDFTDWTNSSNSIPSSCCKTGAPCDIRSYDLKRQGCFEILQVIITSIGWAIAVGVAIISVVQVVAIILAIPLYRAAKKIKKEKMRKEMEIKIPRVRDIWTISEEDVAETARPEVYFAEQPSDQENGPQENELQQSEPQQDVPEENVPEEHVFVEAIPEDILFDEVVPEEVIPEEVVPDVDEPEQIVFSEPPTNGTETETEEIERDQPIRYIVLNFF